MTSSDMLLAFFLVTDTKTSALALAYASMAPTVVESKCTSIAFFFFHVTIKLVCDINQVYINTHIYMVISVGRGVKCPQANGKLVLMSGFLRLV